MRKCAICQQGPLCVFYRIPGHGITTEDEVLCVGCIDEHRTRVLFEAAEGMWERWTGGRAA